VSGKNLFQSSMVAKAKAALLKAEMLRLENHSGIKGKLRELLVGELFQPVLPPEVRIGTGKLVSAEGASSPETDVILYAPAILPPVLFDDKNGYFPAESALYAIEVKSTLTAAELKRAISNAVKTRSLKLMATDHWLPDANANPPVTKFTSGTPSAINALFAFGSDLGGPVSAEFERYCALDQSAMGHSAIQVLCIAGRGYWYSASEGWKHVDADDDIGEVMGFLAGTTNTLPQLMLSKGRPQFGNYLTTDACKPKLI
jgi:hypothetical protein